MTINKGEDRMMMYLVEKPVHEVIDGKLLWRMVKRAAPNIAAKHKREVDAALQKTGGDRGLAKLHLADKGTLYAFARDIGHQLLTFWSNGTFTVAYQGKHPLYMGVSKRSPEDGPDLKRGMKIAAIRCVESILKHRNLFTPTGETDENPTTH